MKESAGLAVRQMLARTPLRPYLTALKTADIIERKHGHFRSSKQWAAVDAAGRALPWYTYPAITYLQVLDLSDSVVFEYGSGNSTRFWAERTRRVHSVESDAAWHRKVAPHLPENAEIELITDAEAYVGALTRMGEPADIIVVDGSHRGSCARQAVEHLAPGGFIVLDNADWYSKTAAFLRSSELVEVDFIGFTPINAYVTCTSLFLHRDFRTTPAGVRQPGHQVGGLKHFPADDY